MSRKTVQTTETGKTRNLYRVMGTSIAAGFLFAVSHSGQAGMHATATYDAPKAAQETVALVEAEPRQQTLQLALQSHIQLEKLHSLKEKVNGHAQNGSTTAQTHGGEPADSAQKRNLDDRPAAFLGRADHLSFSDPMLMTLLFLSVGIALWHAPNSRSINQLRRLFN